MTRPARRLLRARLRGAMMLAAPAAAMGLALAGCGFDFHPIDDYPVNACTLDDDCSAGMCEEAICVAPTSDALRVVVEIDTLSREAAEGPALPARWRLEPRVIVGPELDADLAIPAGVQVLGSVRSGRSTVPADLKFTRRTEVSSARVGAGDGVEARTFLEPESFDVEGRNVQADYAAVLGANGVYDVVVTPTSATMDAGGGDETGANRVFPPLYLDALRVPSGAERWELAFDYPDLSVACSAEITEACTLSGTVQDGEGAPESGLEVRAIERDSGRIVSSLGLTETGVFSIAISPGAGPFDLRVVGGETRDSFPELVSPLPALGADGLTVTVPSLEPVIVAGRVVDDEGAGLGGARVVFTSSALLDAPTVPDVEVQLMRGVTTLDAGDAGLVGAFEVSLLPGLYDVVATPSPAETEDPLDEPGIVVTTLEITADGAELRAVELVAPRRARFGAQVLTIDGEPLPLDVRARPLRPDAGSSPADTDDFARLSRVARVATSASGPTGYFDLRLDVGVFDIVGRPPEGSNHGAVVFVGHRAEEPGETESETVDVAPPVPLAGILRDASGAPVASATLRAFLILSGEEGERSVEIAETRTDAEGAYRLILPSQIDP